MSDVYMEDIHSIGLEAMKVVEERLKEKGVVLTDQQQDEIYVPMCDALEKACGHPDYRHEH